MRTRKARRGASAIAALFAGILVAAGCGSSSGDSTSGGGATSADASCKASIGLMTVLTGAAGPQGTEQLNWGQLAVDRFNQENGTDITLVEGDDQLDPAQGATVAQQFASNNDIVAVVGPESDGVTDSAAPILQRDDIAMVSQSATRSDLTGGQYPTFFRVIAPDSLQGSQDADYMINELNVSKVFVIDDQTGYSRGIADEVVPKLEQAGVTVDQDSVSQKSTDYSALVSKISDDTDVVFLPWMLAANAQLFGEQMKEQGKTATIFGTDGVFSPQDFTIEGSYLSSFSPDLNSDPKFDDLVQDFKSQYGDFGAFGVPAFPAANVILNAIKSVCDSGDEVTRSAVLEAVRNTDLPDSVLGQPIKFEANGELQNAKFFVYTIKGGKYVIAPTP